MSLWIVEGARCLSGDVSVQGSKNAVLPIMAASLLGGGETVLENCPDLLDVDASAQILQHLGCKVSREDDKVYINSSTMDKNHIPHELMLKMRSSVMYLGAILARTGEVTLSRPGGCELGTRPIDLHLSALRQLGAEVSEISGNVHCKANCLTGTHINLDFPSVGATENTMLAACGAKGETIITNAAREPEIVDLQNFLVKCGAKISGAGTAQITISGFEPVKSISHRVISDRIAAATYLCAAAACGGDVMIKNTDPGAISTIISALREMGCGMVWGADWIRIRRNYRLKSGRPVITRPYPGFPTDAQSPLMAASLMAEGTSVFVENIFENRYRAADELRRLGADIRTEGRVAMVSGVERLCGAKLTATDLRGGAAVIIAALSAEGKSEIFDEGHIERGYESFDSALRALGADVTKE